MKIGFLILHYKNFEITQRCIASIKSLQSCTSNEVHMIIVDNGSCDESTKILMQCYEHDTDVDVVILNTAYGFSHGNNLGYAFDKENFNDDFLVVTNNDIIFVQENFIDKMIKIYEKEKFYILGPDMIDVQSGSHLNPRQKPPDIDHSQRHLKILQKKVKKRLVKEDIIGYFQSMKIYQWYKKYIRDKRYSIKQQVELAKFVNYELNVQGGCFILAKEFLKYNDKLFWPETTFYMEEPIMYQRCKKNGWKIMYSPDILVYHEQGLSFKANTKNIKERNRRNFRYSIEATEIYIKYLKEEIFNQTQ